MLDRTCILIRDWDDINMGRGVQVGRGGQVIGNAGNTEDTAQRVGGVRSNMKGELVHSRGKKQPRKT